MTPIAGNPLDNLLPQLLPVLGGYADCAGDGFACRVIDRGSQSTGRDDDLGTLHGLAARRGDTLDIVSDGRRAIDVHAQVAQREGEMAGVRIYDLSEQNLGSDGDDLCGWHVIEYSEAGAGEVSTEQP